MRVLIAVLVVLLLLLNVQLWKTEGQGVRQVRTLEVLVEAQKRQNATLEERNRALEAEVNSLKQDLDAIEERARVDLGMIREDETFFHVLEQMPAPAQSGTAEP